MSQFVGAPIFDADQHMYESADALTRHLPDQYQSAVQFVQIGRHTRIAINSVITEYIPNPTFDRVARPGAHEAYFAGQNSDGLSLKELTGRGIDALPAYRNPEDRLPLLDEQGVNETFMFPTLANLVEHSAAEDFELTAAIIHALNQWMLETWSFDFKGRIFATPVITCGTVENARREFEFAATNGARIVLIKPAPVCGPNGWRSPALPEFDALWRDIESSGIPVALHASQPPLDSYINKWESARTNNFMTQSAFRNVVLGHREISDMVASLICHGTLTRFPKLRILSVENGSDWIHPLFNDFASWYKKMPQAFEEHPHEVFRRNLFISPFWEGSVLDLVDVVGWDRVLFGSDYPHPEGLAEPVGYYNYAEPMNEKLSYDFMGDNARRMMNLPVLNPSGDAAAA
ncbi:MAG: amidohydrolase family protein [Candidatus Nanopelagicales bacterium]|nr:amidohydrolase family protein [Candidatus Nanopelagicales bacterium]